MVNELPNKENALVEDKKLLEYLLNLEHEDGGPKAKFFIGQGFSQDNIEHLREILIAHADKNPVVKIATTKYITKYIIEGPVSFTKQRGGYSSKVVPTLYLTATTMNIVTVWGIEFNSNIPRLVSAYPM